MLRLFLFFKDVYLMGKKKSKTVIYSKQPAKCRGCIWGRWEGTKQFCSKQKCILLLSTNKEGNPS
ncbi:hypothetical protein CF651_18990 [Paenibacillus rigui]|uniref:Uncharacterized protein n=1 Tax=Paenibacillus rigui TaxID=554312 RepID=A0A229UMS9_9BACL|nr:hypothetical protein CF651_18990 [Paenibacillus rigui]